MIRKISIIVVFAVLFSPFYADAVPGSRSVEIAGTTYDISYDAEGMAILSIEPDLEQIELILQVEVTSSPGILEITFDREFFDATFEGEDDEFFAIADGDFVEIKRVETTSESRTLRMEFPLGTEEVEIFGTVLVGATFEEPIPEVMEEEVMEEKVMEEEVMEEKPEVMEEEVMEEKPEVMEVEKPKIQCGPGTILKDGACVLDERCGPGTHFENGMCVLDEKPSGISITERSISTQFIFGVVAAFVIAIIIILVLWGVSKGSRQQQPTINR